MKGFPCFLLLDHFNLLLLTLLPNSELVLFHLHPLVIRIHGLYTTLRDLILGLFSSAFKYGVSADIPLVRLRNLPPGPTELQTHPQFQITAAI